MNDIAPAPEPIVQGKIGLRVEQFVKVRERRRTLKKAFEKADEEWSLVENKLSAAIMLLLNEMGVESARCNAGTCFKTTRTTASLADPDAFMKHVIATEQFELLDRKANTTAVKDYLAKNNSLPPGTNLSSMVTIGVHKKAGGGADASAQSNGNGDQT